MRFFPTITLLSLIATSFGPMGVQAAILPDITVQTFNSPTVYYRDFDVEVLDFTLQTAGTDALQTLTVVQNGTARVGLEYTSIKLWADEGPADFQGWGIDKSLGQIAFVDGHWLVQNINYAFDVSHRFFVSIESGELPGDKLAQFALQSTLDNGDGIWQSGEQGVFMKSRAIAHVPDSAYSTTTRFKSLKSDILPPKGYISTFSAEATVSPVFLVKPILPLEIRGESKDRSGGIVTSASLTINGKDVAVTNTGTNFSQWSTLYAPTLGYEELTVVLNLTDGSGKTWQSPTYRVNIDSRKASFDATTIAVAKNSIDGDGKDATRVSIILNDDSFSTLQHRTLRFKTLRSADLLSSAEAITDAFGRAEVTLTSTQAGTAVVQVSEGEDLVGGVAVLVREAAQPEPAPQPQPQPGALQKGDLIKGSISAVYYFDGAKRHVFVNEEIYRSWYGTDFSAVKAIADADLAAIPLGFSVGFRPGTLIKTPSVPNVYVVDLHQTLRHVASEPVALSVFGTQWNKQIHDLSEALLFTYKFGNDVTTVSDFNQQNIAGMTLTIADEL